MRTTRSTVHFPDGSVLCLFSVVVTYEWGLVRMQLKEIRKQGKSHGASSSLRERERERETAVVDALMLTLDQISSDPTAGVAYYCKQAKWLVLSQYITVSTRLMLTSTVKSIYQNDD